MTQVPPTPVLPLRMGMPFNLERGWDEESMLMDQQPGFGDESIFDISFNIEHSRAEMDAAEMDTPKRGESSRSVLLQDVTREEEGIIGNSNRVSEQDIGARSGSPSSWDRSRETTPRAGHQLDEDDMECEIPRNALTPADRNEALEFEGPTEAFDDDDPDEPAFEPDPASYHPQNLSQDIGPVSPRPLRSLKSPARGETLLEETSFSGWGEQPTIADLELVLSPVIPARGGLSNTSIASSSSISGSFSHQKRVATPPRQSSEKKKMKPRSPGRDDYYSRRLSRQSFNGSSTSLSLPSLYLSNSTLSKSQSISRPKESSGGGPSRYTSSLASSPRELVRKVIDQDISLQEHAPPAPRPTMLSRFLAKSTILHPISPRPTEKIDRPSSRTSSPVPLSSRTTEEQVSLPPLEEDLPIPSALAQVSDDVAMKCGDTSIIREVSKSSGSDLGSSLRRSTSQRVIGFFSDLLRTSTPSKPVDAVAPEVVLDEYDGRDQSLAAEDLEHDAEDASLSSQSDYQNDPSTSHHAQPYRPPSLASQHAFNPPGYRPLTRPNQAPISHTALRAANSIRQPRPLPLSKSISKPKPISSFASAALARLPPPGKGASDAGEKITVKAIERAGNLQARRALFERPTNLPVSSTSTRPNTGVQAGGMKKTTPLVGKPPGKAAKARAEERRQFDSGLQERLVEKRREKEQEEMKRKEEEERAYRAMRKETVVKAKPVPKMYRTRP